MIKYSIALLFLLSSSPLKAQQIETVYLIPGQGFDKQLFDSINIDTCFRIAYLEFDTPDKKISMHDFALQLCEQIDTTETFALIGVSLGGMLCIEMSEILNPTKVILISSVTNRNEFPFRYSIFTQFPVYELIPAGIMYSCAKVLQPLVEPDTKNNKETFNKMLNTKTPQYIKNTSRLIIQWNRTSNNKEFVRIHGTNDHTLPIKNIKNPDYVIENGSHMMTLTRADEISLILNEVLLAKQ